MQVDQGIFVKLMLAVFGLALVGFLVRGIGTVIAVFGIESATLLALPFFAVALALAAGAFVLAVLITVGVVESTAGANGQPD